MISDEAGKLALVLCWQLLNHIPCSELGWILKSRECKDEAVRWSVKFGYLWADNRLCYWHTHYQRPYTSFFCLTLTIVLQGLEWMLLTPELNSRRRTDCWFYFVEIGRGHIFLKQKKKKLWFVLPVNGKIQKGKSVSAYFTNIRQPIAVSSSCSPG